jgi:hypothetical protein
MHVILLIGLFFREYVDPGEGTSRSGQTGTESNDLLQHGITTSASIQPPMGRGRARVRGGPRVRGRGTSKYPPCISTNRGGRGRKR